MEQAIEKGIPQPAERSASVRYGVLDRMEVGYSTLFPAGTNIASLARCMAYRKMRYGKRFVHRAVEGGQRRVWRAA